MQMPRRRDGERGQVAVYAVLLFPTLMLVLVFVLAVSSVEMLRSRLRAQLDMAALTATQAIDLGALAAGGHPALVPDKAESLARQYIAANVASLGDQLLVTPEAVAGGAQVAVTNRAGADPITGQAISAHPPVGKGENDDESDHERRILAKHHAQGRPERQTRSRGMIGPGKGVGHRHQDGTQGEHPGHRDQNGISRRGHCQRKEQAKSACEHVKSSPSRDQRHRAAGQFGGQQAGIAGDQAVDRKLWIDAEAGREQRSVVHRQIA